MTKNSKSWLLDKKTTKWLLNKIAPFFLLAIIVLMVAGTFVIGPQAVHASCTGPNCYIPLVSLGTDITGCDTSSSPTGLGLAGYISAIVKLCIFAAGIIAVVEITYGGFKYLFSTSEPGKSGGRENINNALIGLALALCSWLILDTVNPQLVSLSVFTGDIATTGGSSSTTTTNPCGGTVQSVNNGSNNGSGSGSTIGSGSSNPTTPPGMTLPGGH